MNLIAALALAGSVLAAGAPVGFESDGVRVGTDLVQGSVIELRDAESGSILISGSCVEPLASVVSVKLGSDHEISVEPGVRLERSGDGYVLTTHGQRLIEIGSVVAESPVSLSLTETGWVVGGVEVSGKVLGAMLAQDKKGDKKGDKKKDDKSGDKGGKSGDKGGKSVDKSGKSLDKGGKSADKDSGKGKGGMPGRQPSTRGQSGRSGAGVRPSVTVVIAENPSITSEGAAPQTIQVIVEQVLDDQGVVSPNGQ